MFTAPKRTPLPTLASAIVLPARVVLPDIEFARGPIRARMRGMGALIEGGRPPLIPAYHPRARISAQSQVLTGSPCAFHPPTCGLTHTPLLNFAPSVSGRPPTGQGFGSVEL